MLSIETFPGVHLIFDWTNTCITHESVWFNVLSLFLRQGLFYILELIIETRLALNLQPAVLLPLAAECWVCVTMPDREDIFGLLCHNWYKS